MKILLLVIGGVVAFCVWLAQSHRTKKRVRLVLYNDIQKWRQTVILMGDFFQNLKASLERKEAKRFDFRMSDFPVYYHMLPQIHLFSEHEIDVITSFYEYYKTLEGDILGTSDTLRQWAEIQKENKEIDDKRRAIALYGLERITKLRELLLQNTEGKSIKEFKSSYHEPLQLHLKQYKEKVKEDTGFEFL